MINQSGQRFYRWKPGDACYAWKSIWCGSCLRCVRSRLHVTKTIALEEAIENSSEHWQVLVISCHFKQAHLERLELEEGRWRTWQLVKGFPSTWGLWSMNLIRRPHKAENANLFWTPQEALRKKGSEETAKSVTHIPLKYSEFLAIWQGSIQH